MDCLKTEKYREVVLYHKCNMRRKNEDLISLWIFEAETHTVCQKNRFVMTLLSITFYCNFLPHFASHAHDDITVTVLKILELFLFENLAENQFISNDL